MMIQFSQFSLTKILNAVLPRSPPPLFFKNLCKNLSEDEESVKFHSPVALPQTKVAFPLFVLFMPQALSAVARGTGFLPGGM